MSGIYRRDPQAWEAGCAQDPVRADVVIPDIEDRVSSIGARRCCDLGSGTGYLVYQLLQREGIGQTTWTLLENDVDMLSYSRTRFDQTDRVEIVEYNVHKPNSAMEGSFDFVFCSFSSLEFGMSQAVARTCLSLLASGGRIALYLPDLLEDIVQEVRIQRSVSPLENYRRKSHHVRKPDKFTGKNEPFVAYRFERLISDFLANGAMCSALRFLPRDEDRAIVVIEFSNP